MNPTQQQNKSISVRSRFLVAACLGLALSSGCIAEPLRPAAQTKDKAAPSIGQPFVIAAGASVTLDSGAIRVTFKEVKNDSRCPVDVSCIWEGDATVVILAKKADRDTAIELHTSSRFSAEAAYEGYRIRLQDLKPQPKSSVTIDQKAYTATLIITRVP